MSPVSNKIALFIDGATSSNCKTLGFDIDYKRFSRNSRAAARCARVLLHAIIEDQEYSSIRPLIDWLDYNGYPSSQGDQGIHRRQRPRKVKAIWTSNSRSMHGARRTCRPIVLFSVTRFRSLVEAVQRPAFASPCFDNFEPAAMIADELRRRRRVHRSRRTQSKLGRDPSNARPASASSRPAIPAARDHHGAARRRR